MDKFKPMEEAHCKGIVSIENLPEQRVLLNADLGIQIADDGRVWVCINGIAFLRFKPNRKIKEYVW